MLRWMCGLTRKDMVKDEVILAKVEVASVADKMREARLRQFGHVQRTMTRYPNKVVWCERLLLESLRRGRGRPKKYSREVVRHDMASFLLTEDMILDRRLWRSRIRVEVVVKCLSCQQCQYYFQYFYYSAISMFLILSFILLLDVSYASIFLLSCFCYCLCFHILCF